MSFITALPRKTRGELVTTGLGYVAETFPICANSAGQTMSAQNVRGTAIGLRAGDVVTNIVVSIQTAAAGTAGSVFAGLYDSSLNKLAATADVQASFGSTGVIALALASPYTVTADGLYYAVFLMATAYGTTQPTLLGVSQTGLGTALSGKPRPNWVQAGQSSLPATATAATSGLALWFGVS